MNYWTGGMWLDGPKLAEWLQPLLPNAGASGKGKGWTAAITRRMWDWRKGGAADAYALDQYLCHLGLHLGDLPDELWLPEEEWPLAGPKGSRPSRAAR